jgi:hypothetical protein
MERSLLRGESMDPIKGKQRIFWLAGVVMIICGVLLAALLIVGSRNPDPVPHVDVPSMQNVPGPDRKLGVEIEKEP